MWAPKYAMKVREEGRREERKGGGRIDPLHL